MVQDKRNIKLIHYCWFGGNEMPQDVTETINAWKNILTDYKFVCWSEENFDINSNNFVKQAHKQKKYAYVTDYVRLYALYNFGGIYMDTDVTVLKKLDRFLEHGAFTGCESDTMCVTGIMGAKKGHPWIKMLLDEYKNKNFIVNGEIDLTPNTKMITKLTIENYCWQEVNKYQILKKDLHIYPFEYFCAKNWEDGKINITENTYTIHNFNGSWLPKYKRLLINTKGVIKNFLRMILGTENYNKLIKRKRGM